jgi:hypothetical protein
MIDSKVAKMYTSPSLTSPVTLLIAYPKRFKLIASQNGFYQIQYKGKTGWVWGEPVLTFRPLPIKDGPGTFSG